MADFAFYWPRYLNESGHDGEPVTGWLTSRDWLVNRLQCSDRLWLFIGGDACGDNDEPHRAYVAGLVVVDHWANYDEYDPEVPGSPRFRIHGIADRCALLNPPALVDSIFRKPGGDPKQHIGIVRQTPFQLEDSQVGALLEMLSAFYPDVYITATQ
jgi:hypothetical protein